MGYWKDITGKRYGYLTVEKYLGQSNWECKCVCGQSKTVKTGALNNGATKSCGCFKYTMRKKPSLELIGEKFNSLTLIEFIEMKEVKRYKRLRRYEIWKCKCDCGKIKIARLKNVISGQTKSCGDRAHTAGGENWN